MVFGLMTLDDQIQRLNIGLMVGFKLVTTNSKSGSSPKQVQQNFNMGLKPGVLLTRLIIGSTWIKIRVLSWLG